MSLRRVDVEDICDPILWHLFVLYYQVLDIFYYGLFKGKGWIVKSLKIVMPFNPNLGMDVNGRGNTKVININMNVTNN